MPPASPVVKSRNDDDAPGSVVVVVFARHTAGYGPAAGTASALAQSAAYDATQSTHWTTSASPLTVPPHDEPPGGVRLGQLVGKPMSSGVKSPPPPQTRSAPPHALQILRTLRSS